MTTPEKIANEAQQLAMDTVVALFELDATAIGDTIYCFTAAPLVPDPTDPIPEAVSWGGTTYQPIPCESEGWEYTGKGSIPRPRLRVANVNGAFTAAAIAGGDLVGCVVTRYRTYARHLDGGTDPDPEAYWPPDVYRIDRKSAHTRLMMEWELAPPFDQQSALLPARQILRDACTHRYRYWTGTAFDYTKATCPYVGTTYYDATGTVTLDPAADRCGKRLGDCKKRFGNAGILPTRAFPGVDRVRR